MSVRFHIWIIIDCESGMRGGNGNHIRHLVPLTRGALRHRQDEISMRSGISRVSFRLE
jgi:hypothetical protein